MWVGDATPPAHNMVAYTLPLRITLPPAHPAVAVPPPTAGANVCQRRLTHQKQPTAKRRTQCHICGLDLLKTTLHRHLWTRHGQQSTSQQMTTYACSTCDQIFKRKDIRDNHEVEQHGGEVGYIECTYCGKVVRKRYLSQHFRRLVCRKDQLAWAAQRSRSAITTASGAHPHADQGLHVITDTQFLLLSWHFLQKVSRRTYECDLTSSRRKFTYGLSPSHPPPQQITDVLELEARILGSVSRCLQELHQSSDLLIAISYLITAKSLFNGHDQAAPHWRVLPHLVKRGYNSSSCARPSIEDLEEVMTTKMCSRDVRMRVDDWCRFVSIEIWYSPGKVTQKDGVVQISTPSFPLDALPGNSEDVSCFYLWAAR